MPLIPLNSNNKPGRLPDNEAVSLNALLKANGFTDDDCLMARSDTVQKADLDSRFQAVLAVEDKFTHGSNVDSGKRRAFRIELENTYDLLLDAAERYRDDASDAYDNALNAEVTKIRTANPAVNQLFKGNGPWKDGAAAGVVLDARVAKWVSLASFQEAVFKAYNKQYKPNAGPVVQPLTQQEQQALQSEKDRVNAQLAIWDAPGNPLRADAQGCNINGTWGTSAGGAAANFNATHLSDRVWARLKKWWQAKAGAYVTPSDTTTYSLKMYRNVADTISATFNYHIYTP